MVKTLVGILLLLLGNFAVPQECLSSFPELANAVSDIGEYKFAFSKGDLEFFNEFLVILHWRRGIVVLGSHNKNQPKRLAPQDRRVYVKFTPSISSKDLVVPLGFLAYRDILLLLSTFRSNFLLNRPHGFHGSLNFVPRNVLYIKVNFGRCIQSYKLQVEFVQHTVPKVQIRWIPAPITAEYTFLRKSKNFNGYPFVAKRLLFLHPSLFKPFLCKNLNAVTPWTAFLDVWIVCHFSHLANVTISRTSQVSTTVSYVALIQPTETSSNAALLNIGRVIRVGFLFPVKESWMTWHNLRGPLERSLVIATFTTAGILIGFLYTGVKSLRRGRLTLLKITGIILRPLLEQCQEDLCIPYNFIRVALFPWLLFTVMITDLHKGGMISHMVNPKVVGPTTFSELAESGRSVFTVGWVSKTGGRLLNNTEHNCTIRVNSGPFAAFNGDHARRKLSQSHAKIMKNFLHCDGRNVEKSVIQRIRRLCIDKDVLLAYAQDLKYYKIVGEHMFRNLRTVLSSEIIRSNMYVAVTKDIFYPEMTTFLNRVACMGMQSYLGNAYEWLRNLRFWSKSINPYDAAEDEEEHKMSGIKDEEEPEALKLQSVLKFASTWIMATLVAACTFLVELCGGRFNSKRGYENFSQVGFVRAREFVYMTNLKTDVHLVLSPTRGPTDVNVTSAALAEVSI